jgi:uncharacterized delta-60 repeat protein
MKKLFSVRTIILAGSLLLQLNTLSFLSRGAAGDVDLSFDPGSGVNGPVIIVVVQPNGKVLIGGDFTTVKGLARAGIARLNADGSGDSTFNAGAPGDRYVSAIALQSDGKIIVNNGSVIRLNSDGSYDSSFPLYPVVGDYAVTTSFAVQPDGKVLVGGYTITETIDPDGSAVYLYHHYLTRDFANGNHDTSFISAVGFGATSSFTSLPDGKVLICGNDGNGIVRLNANGGLDNSFNSDVIGLFSSVAVQSDGKLLLGGWVIGIGTNRNAIARLNANGSLDGSFNPGAVGPVASVVVQSDGKVLIGGGFTTVNGTNRNGIARLNANGSLDSSFNPGTGAAGVSSVALQSDGKVLIAGTRDNIARLNADGSLDSSFQSGSGVTPSVYSLVVQPDGKVLIGGDFTTVRDLDRSGIARLNADGTVDTSFNLTFTLYSADPDYYPAPTVFSVAVQSDGKVLVGGVFSALNGTNMQNGIIRLNANGSLDNSFKPGVSGSVSSITLLPDGKLLIGGGFIYNFINWTNYSSGLARLNADGTLDGSFNPGNAVGASSVALQPDGKVLVGGSLGVPGRNGITRLNANGSLDNSFNGGAGVEVFGYVASVASQSNGKVLVGGGFSTINGTNRNGIARLNANGSLDGSFNLDMGEDRVNSIGLQPDGKVLIGGSFGLARLNANGSLDVSFNGTGINDDDYYPAVLCVALQSDGKVLIGGGFTTVNGVARPRVARLYGDSFAPPSLNIARSDSAVIVSWPVPGLNFQLQESTNLFPAAWSPVVQTAVTNAGQMSVTVPGTVGRKFFRLKLQ